MLVNYLFNYSFQITIFRHNFDVIFALSVKLLKNNKYNKTTKVILICFMYQASFILFFPSKQNIFPSYFFLLLETLPIPSIMQSIGEH